MESKTDMGMSMVISPRKESDKWAYAEKKPGKIPAPTAPENYSWTACGPTSHRSGTVRMGNAVPDLNRYGPFHTAAYRTGAAGTFLN